MEPLRIKVCTDIRLLDDGGLNIEFQEIEIPGGRVVDDGKELPPREIDVPVRFTNFDEPRQHVAGTGALDKIRAK